MADLLLGVTSLISAMVAYLVCIVFLLAYNKDKKTGRLLWSIAFLLYGIGHTIVVLIASDIIIAEALLPAMWAYVNLAGAGTTGLVLYAVFPFITEKKWLRSVVVMIFLGLYVIGSALFAFVLPDENIFAIINPTAHSQLSNMSWWVVEILIPASYVVGYSFLKHYKITGAKWGLLIGLSFVMYATLLFIWPIPDLKPIFYVLRTVSVGLLAGGGILLARE